MTTNTHSFSLIGNLPKILLGLLGNALYFIYFEDSYPNCGVACVVFFNLAFLSLFLPMFATAVTKSEYLKSGLQLLAWGYFFIEVLLAVCLLGNNSPAKTALLWQAAFFVIFIALFFYIDNSNRKTNTTIRMTKEAISPSLLEAKMIISDKLTLTSDPVEAAALRSALADLNSSPISSFPHTADLESRILSLANELISEPGREISASFSQLVMRRNNMIRIMQQ